MIGGSEKHNSLVEKVQVKFTRAISLETFSDLKTNTHHQ